MSRQQTEDRKFQVGITLDLATLAQLADLAAWRHSNRSAVIRDLIGAAHAAETPKRSSTTRVPRTRRQETDR